MKPAPSYWWDFDPEGRVIVQSDRPGGERLAECSTPEEAQQLIADYSAGRVNPPFSKPSSAESKSRRR